MKNWILVGMLIAGTGCGVNPDRMKKLEERERESVEKSTSTSVTLIEADANDPDEVKQAISGLQQMAAALEGGDMMTYRDARYGVLRIVSYEANEAIATNRKTHKIAAQMAQLDQNASAAIGAGGESLADPDRAPRASLDAIYAINEGLVACSKVGEANDRDSVELGYANFNAAISKAKGLDANSVRYTGKNPAATGSYIDVPFETALCEFSVRSRRNHLEDAPAVATDLSSVYNGCGVYPLLLESNQQSSGGFGAFAITSFYAQEADPGAAEPVGCEKIPPVTDANPDVLSVIKSGVVWLTDADIVSLEGAFEYEQRTPSQMVKKAKVMVFRRSASLKTNKCGAKDANVTCEAEGSVLATSYNATTHYLNRAETYKAQQNAKSCGTMVDNAISAAVIVDEEQTKIYQVAEKRRFAYDELRAKLSAAKTQAEEMKASSWCETAQ